MLKAKRKDLQMPCDLLRADHRFFLQIAEPKMTEVCSPLLKSAGICHGSLSVYRRRWDFILERLGIAQTYKLTPGSLRGGGAVAAYQNGVDIPTLQWKMRLQNQATLAFYLQEVAAGSILPSLPRHAKEAIEASKALFPFFFVPAQRTSA